MKYPRLLLITPCAFNPLSGGGITFNNLFRGWPPERIAMAHSDRVQPSIDVCNKYYFLGRKEFPWMFPFSLANREGREIFERKLKDARSKSSMKHLFNAAQWIVGDEIPTRAVLSEDFRSWIADFKPEVLYTILGSLPYIRLVRRIAEEFHLPVVIHMMDDWPEVLYRRGIFGPYRRFRMRVELQQLMDKAASCLAICDPMAAAYEKCYGRKFLAFHNALDASSWLVKSRKEWSKGSPFLLLYAGALMENSQAKSVEDVCDAVAALHANGLDIEFKIYAPWYMAKLYRERLERQGCVEVLDAPEKMEASELFTKPDLLILPVNFDKDTVNYVRYSMPTKIPAYMFSGTPTLAYGPSTVASIQYAKQWAYCVTKRDREELSAAIRKLSEDELLRKELGLRAQKLAQEKHDAVKVRKEFHAALTSCSK